MERTTLMDAFTRFDVLVQRFAGAGTLTEKQKQQLDEALTLHAQAADHLKHPKGAAVPEFAPA